VNYQLGEKYKFLVSRVHNKKLSIVFDGNQEHTFPGELIKDSYVELYIKDIHYGKLFFQENPFYHTGNSNLSGILIQVYEYGGQAMGKINFNNHLVQIVFPRWLLKTEYICVGETIFFKLKRNTNGPLPILQIQFENLVEHYKFKDGERYEFVVQSIANGFLIIYDKEDDLTYKTPNHFSNLNLKTNDSINLIYFGLDKHFKPVFIQDKDSKFVAPNQILNSEELDFLSEVKKYDYESQDLIKKQLRDRDNFWIITSIKYLPGFVKFSLKKGEISDTLNALQLFKSLKGFIEARKYFDSVPYSVRNSVQPLFIKSAEFIDAIQLLFDFQKVSPLEELFSDLTDYSTEDQFSILNTALNYGVFDVKETDTLENILENIVQIKNEDEQIIRLDLFCKVFLNFFCKPLFRKSVEVYFSSLEAKQNWLRNAKINTIIKIVNELYLYKDIISPRRLLQIERVRQLYYLTFSTSSLDDALDKLKTQLIDVVEAHNISDFQLNFDDGKVEFNDEIQIISNTIGIKITKSRIIIVSGSEIHLFNYFIDKYGKIFGDIISSSSGFLLVKIIYPQHFKLSNELIYENVIPVVMKGEKTSYGGLFVSHNFEDKKLIDGLVYPSSTFIGLEEIYSPGDCLNVKIISDTPEKQTFIHYNDRYLIDEKDLGHNFIAKVVYKSANINRLSLCANCKEPLIEFDWTEFYKTCNTCTRNYFSYVELYIEEINKYIQVNQYTIKDNFENNYFEKLTLGKRYSINIIGKKPLKYYNPYNKNSFYKDFYDVEIINFIDVRLARNIHEYGKYFPKLSSGISFNLLNLVFTGLVESFVSHSDSNSQNVEGLIAIIESMGRIFRSPKVYLVVALNRYKRLIESIQDDLLITDNFKLQKTKFNQDYTDTVGYYPEFQGILDTLDIIEKIDSSSISELSQIFDTSNNQSVKNISKAIIIRNLLKTDLENIEFKKNLDFQLQELLKKNISNISLGSTFVSDIEEDENLSLIKEIEKGHISENSDFEFKETLYVPVLSQKQHRIIEDLEKKISESDSESKRESLKTKIAEIERSVSNSMESKDRRNDVVFSTFKNICAFLNSNKGKIIIGIRDSGELIGLANDYKLRTDWDDFQLNFENYWNVIFQEPQTFRPYIKLNKVNYQNKDFAIIDVGYPEDIKEPCIIYDITKPGNQEKCYVKNSSSTDSLKLASLYKWKRKRHTLVETPTYVYLMSDKNNFTKIGMSNNPTARNTTLMAQDSQIRLIEAYKFRNRGVAKHFEDHLQAKYKEFNSNNGKGEWFKLDENQIADIQLNLKKHSIGQLSNEESGTLF
jgi:hypothetical protein